MVEKEDFFKLVIEHYQAIRHAQVRWSGDDPVIDQAQAAISSFGNQAITGRRRPRVDADNSHCGSVRVFQGCHGLLRDVQIMINVLHIVQLFEAFYNA